MCKPTPDLVLELDHLLAYLIRTRTLGLTYSRESSKLEAYSDASWEERNSTSQVGLYCGNMLPSRGARVVSKVSPFPRARPRSLHFPRPPKMSSICVGS